MRSQFHAPSHDARLSSQELNDAWLAAMRRGDFAAAAAVSDHVLAQRDPAMRNDPSRPYHARWVWDGRPFAGRHVLVRCYHGLGDTIQFARFLPILRQQVASLMVECQPALMPLLAPLVGPHRLIPFRPEAPAPAAECDLEIMELMHALRLTPEAARPPYLAVPDQFVARAQARFGLGSALRVGLCWRCGDWAEDRSVPLAALAEACVTPGVEFVSLQRGAAAAEANTADAPRFLNPEDRSCNMLETAGQLMALDLVITIDTMVAHLAGALARPVWLLLKAEADWRWMVERDDSPWYPSMRLYRQRIAGDWAAPLARLCDDLRQWRDARQRASAAACGKVVSQPPPSAL